VGSTAQNYGIELFICKVVCHTNNMGNVTNLRPVVRVHEAFLPSRRVRKTLDELLVETDQPREYKMRLNTSRILDAGEYARHRHDGQLKSAQSKIDALAKQVLYLSGRMAIDEGRGTSRILFEPRSTQEIAEAALPLGDIPSLELYRPPQLLYVTVATDALRRNVHERMDTLGQFELMGRHPGMKRQLYAEEPHLLEEHILRYPFREEG
jgi:hypothetical protein